MNLHLNNKFVLVTGSSRGIGFSIARLLQEEGCQIILNGRDPYTLQKAMSKLPGSFGFLADLTCREQSTRLISDVMSVCGRLDGLVCNVGSGRSVPPGKETLEEWQRVFALNLWSTTNIVEAATSALVDSKGSIVCISSICGQEVVPNAPVTYSAAKSALNAFVRGISRPFGKQGVRINAVAPGNILFNDSVWSRKLKEDKDLVAQILERDVSLSRLGSPTEVAYLVAYLLSPRSGFATGSIWPLDGGQVHS